MRAAKPFAGRRTPRPVLVVGPPLTASGGVSTFLRVVRDEFAAERVVFMNFWWPRRSANARSGLLRGALAAVYLVRFLAYCLAVRPRAVHLQTSSDLLPILREAVAALTARALRIPVIVHLHGGSFPELLSHPVPRAVVRHLLLVADVALVLSPTALELFRDVNPRGNLRVVPNPVPRSFMSRIWQDRTGDRESFRILCTGVVGRRKGQLDLIRTAEKLRTEHPGVEVVLAGPQEDPLDAELWEAVRSASDWVDYVRVVHGQALIDLYDSVDCFSLFSYSDALPIAVLEAMAAGLPVVSTSVGSIPSVITDGVEGFLVAPGDTSGLAQRLESLLKDPELRSKLGSAGRRRVLECYSPERVSRDLAALYDEFGGPEARA